VRAYNPVPGAWFTHGGERIKCWRAAALPGADAPAGTVLAAGEDGIDVACADGMLRLLSLQRPGRKTVSAAEFASQLPLAGAALR
jgi:methionyl-tRNA formyltransferase